MKLLLYCTKGKPLFLTYGDCDNGDYATYFEEYVCDNRYYDYGYEDKVIEPKDFLNGKIVAECDFEVEKIYRTFDIRKDFYTVKTNVDDLYNETCLTYEELCDYLGNGNNGSGYAIHIKSLHIFDKPKELKDFEKIIGRNEFESERCDFCSKDSCENCHCNYLLVDLEKAPQNMMYVFDGEEKKVLISIHPEWLCKILNGEKTIEVRKKVLKEMIK